MRQINRRFRLQILLRNAHANAHSAQLSSILEPDRVTGPKILDAEATAAYLAPLPHMDRIDHDLVLAYLNASGPQYLDCQHRPLFQDSRVFPPVAKLRTEVRVEDRTYSCLDSHRGNSAIQFYHPDTRHSETGFITSILCIPLQGILRNFIIVTLHKPLPEAELKKTPFPEHPRWLTTAVDVDLSDTRVVIEVEHIITHLSTYLRPIGTYGVEKPFLVICWALNRGRR